MKVEKFILLFVTLESCCQKLVFPPKFLCQEKSIPFLVHIFKWLYAFLMKFLYKLFKVYIKNSNALSTDHLNASSNSLLNLSLYPNPNVGVVNIAFHLAKQEDVTLSVLDATGAMIKKIVLKNLAQGKNVYNMNIAKLTAGSMYFFTLETATQKVTQKLVVKR